LVEAVAFGADGVGVVEVGETGPGRPAVLAGVVTAAASGSARSGPNVAASPISVPAVGLGNRC